MPTKLKSLKELASEYGVSLWTIGQWKKKGLNIYDPIAVRKFKAGRERGPIHGSKGNEEVVVKGQTIEELRKELSAATTYTQTRVIKLKIEAMQRLFDYEVTRGAHIPRVDVVRDITRVASVIKAGHMRVRADLPPVLVGLDEAAIERRLADRLEQLLNQFGDLTADLYPPQK